jgi:IS5 family transposase
VEDAIYDSYAFRKFMNVDFLGEEQAPDATTLCKFRKLLNDSGITRLLFDAIRDFLDKHGRLMHGGTIDKHRFNPPRSLCGVFTPPAALSKP